MRVDISNGIAHSDDLLGNFIRDLSAKFIFKSHDQLNEIQRISLELLAKASLRCDLCLVRAEQVFDNRLYFIKCV